MRVHYCFHSPGVPDLEHSALWHRAYNLVWNEWFKDENIQQSVIVNLGDGPDPEADYTLLRRGKRLDYFTSCLPFAQKDYGNPVLLNDFVNPFPDMFDVP